MANTRWVSNLGTKLIKSVSMEVVPLDVNKYRCKHCGRLIGDDQPNAEWKCNGAIEPRPLLTLEDVYEDWLVLQPNQAFQHYCEEQLEIDKNNRAADALVELLLPDGQLICQSTLYYQVKPTVLDRYDNDFLEFWDAFRSKGNGYHNLLGVDPNQENKRDDQQPK